MASNDLNAGSSDRKWNGGIGTLMKFLKEFDTEKNDIDGAIVKPLRSKGIKVVYEPSVVSKDPKNRVGRILFSTQRFKADFRDLMVQSCGGLVIEYKTWKMLALPPNPFNPKCALSKINIDDYTITYADDGTTVTLYYYPPLNKWCMSTTNGYDVSDYKWSGEKTYKEVLDEVLNEYQDFSWEKLDKEASYTIGFHHPDFHPFHAPLEKEKHAWLLRIWKGSISHVERQGYEALHPGGIGLPYQSDNVVKADVKTLIERSKNSIADFIKSKHVLYGFILRKNNTSDSNHQYDNVLIESYLLKKIRDIVYNDKEGLLNSHDEKYVGATNRLKYISLKSYLSIQNKEIFITLFPQFQDAYNKYKVFIEQLAQRIITNAEHSKTECLENDIRTVLANRHKFRVSYHTSVGVVIDLISSTEWLDQYYKYIYNE